MRVVDLLQTTDAMVWAKEFVRICKTAGWTLEDIDKGLMVGWFANAMGAQEMADRRNAKSMRCETCKWWDKFSSDIYGECSSRETRKDMDSIIFPGPQFYCCHWEEKE